jgi:hypothetical protein
VNSQQPTGALLGATSSSLLKQSVFLEADSVIKQMWTDIFVAVKEYNNN